MGSGVRCLRLLQCSSPPHSGAMTYQDLPPNATVLQITLQPQDPVLPLQCLRGQCARLEVLSGRLWLTQHGRSDDWFLERGQGMTLTGPVQLYASADGRAPLHLRWVQERAAGPATAPTVTPPLPGRHSAGTCQAAGVSA